VQVGSVLGITRYPVKSMGGESLERVGVTPRGLHGDRAWAIYTADGGIGSGKTSRRFRRVDGLLELHSRLRGDVPVIAFPDGSTAVATDPDTERRLSALLGRPLAVRAETTVPHHDEAPVHVLTTASLRHLGDLLGEPVDPRRLRANLLLDVDRAGFAEDAWKGGRLRIGDTVVLALGDGMPRCAMVNAAQPALPHESRMLKLIAHANDLKLGLQAAVARPGEIATGDPVLLA
jgi:uncharacterized protein YcbX